jgi:hypothetical protein
MAYNGKWKGDINNLLKIHSLAYAEEIEAGTDWYTKANQWAHGIAETYSLNVDLVIDITAAISPNNQWERNKTDTVRVIKAWMEGETDPSEINCCTYNTNVGLALDMLYSGVSKLSGPKVTAFAHNIRYPQSVGDDVVTIDIWAYRAWVWDSRAKITINDEMSKTCATDYIEAARKVARCPRDFQAIVWLVTRRAGGYGRGKYCGLNKMAMQLRLI